MIIESAPVTSPLLAEYAAIPIAFEVTSVLAARAAGAGRFVLVEHPIAVPYLKDYDALGESPRAWASRFDTSRWCLFVARREGRTVGGAAVAGAFPGLDMLDGRDDLAMLWDIRVVPAWRGQGVGQVLCETAAAWAAGQGNRELKVETQNVNVPACRFYAAMGFELREVHTDAYAQCPGEDQYLWYKRLGIGPDPATA